MKKSHIYGKNQCFFKNSLQTDWRKKIKELSILLNYFSNFSLLCIERYIKRTELNFLLIITIFPSSRLSVIMCTLLSAIDFCAHFCPLSICLLRRHLYCIVTMTFKMIFMWTCRNAGYILVPLSFPYDIFYCGHSFYLVKT